MSLGHGAQIVRDGLVLLLDAANPKSYPGSGTTWTDLSGNDNHFTISGASFSSNTPHFSFTDNAGNYIYRNETDVIGGFDAITFETWVRLDTIQDQISFISYAVDPSLNNEYLVFKNGTNTFSLFHNTPSNNLTVSDSLLGPNTWFQLVSTRSGANTSIYINGSFVDNDTAVPTGTFSTGGALLFGQEQDNELGGFQTTQDFPGDLAVAKIYNRVLTLAEIKQNFEATRGRFGI